MAALTPALFAQQRGNSEIAAAAMAGEFLVQFKAGSGAAERARAIGRANGRVLEEVLSGQGRRDGKGDLILVHHQPDLPPQAARAALAADPAVEFVEPNWIYTHQTDPSYTNGSLWGLYSSTTTPANQFGSNAGATRGSLQNVNTTVYVGVIPKPPTAGPELDRQWISGRSLRRNRSRGLGNFYKERERSLSMMKTPDKAGKSQGVLRGTDDYEILADPAEIRLALNELVTIDTTEDR